MVGGGEKDCHNFTDIKQLLNMDELHVFLLEYEKCYQLAGLKKIIYFLKFTNTIKKEIFGLGWMRCASQCCNL